jgi:hypothetical protein
MINRLHSLKLNVFLSSKFFIEAILTPLEDQHGVKPMRCTDTPLTRGLIRPRYVEAWTLLFKTSDRLRT